MYYRNTAEVRFMKKALSAIIALSIILCSLIVPASAVGGSFNNGVTWSIDADGVLTFSGEGEVRNYDYVWDLPWLEQRTDITKVVFEEGITHMGGRVAYCCTEVTEVYISSTVESLGLWPFNIAISLERFIVDENNPYFSVDEYGVLYNKDKTELIRCPGALKGEYTIPDSVTSIRDYAFYYCLNLTEINVPDSVDYIGNYCFSWCKSLKSIKLPEGIGYLGNHLLSWCISLESVEIPSSVTSIRNNVFNHCTKLESVTIPAGLTSVGDFAFAYCQSLKAAILPEGVTDIGENAFAWCEAMTEVSIPDSVKAIGEGAFYRCESLESVSVPASIEKIEARTFGWCSSLKNADIPAGAEIAEDAFYMTAIGQTAIGASNSTAVSGRAYVTYLIKTMQYDEAYDLNGDGRINAYDKSLM